MSDRLRTAVLAGVPFGLAMGAFFWWQHGVPLGPLLGVAAGVMFGAALARFSHSEAVAQGSAAELEPGELIRHEGPANHFTRGDSTGGRLYLTDRRLYFKSHGFNLKDHELTVPLADVAAARATRTLGIIPNGLLIERRDGQRERFVVSGRAAWVAALSGRARGT